MLDERPFEIDDGRRPRLLPVRLRPEVPGRRGSDGHRRPARGRLRRRRHRRAANRTASTGWCCARAWLAPGRSAAGLREVPAAAGQPNSYAFIADTLLANPDVARGTAGAVRTPLRSRISTATARQAVEAARADLARRPSNSVPTLDADRVLRTLHQPDRGDAAHQLLPEQDAPQLQAQTRAASTALPFPRPKFEIWVYSPRVEGVHLRFGNVARGGLRWSDRREDFRTEILGLVKAQTVKNAVIVPTGAKGGFYAKRLPDPAVDRAAWMAEGHGKLPDLHPRLAGHHRQPGPDRVRPDGGAARATWSGTTATIPTSWSRPTRAPRPSPTSPTTLPRSTASGWATPSLPAARSATTTRTWASPPAAPGNRSSATSANWASTPRPRTSPSSASAT